MLELDLREWKSVQSDEKYLRQAWIIKDVCIHSEQIVHENSLFFALNGKEKTGLEFAEQAISNGANSVVAALSLKSEIPVSIQKKAKWIFVEKPIDALQDLATFYRLKTRAKILAITGSYGKTMLKDLLAEIFSGKVYASPESFNSQIGVALSLFQISNFDSFAILEAGISKAGEMEKLEQMIQPDYGLLSNISDAHIEELGSLEATAKEKIKLFKNLKHWLLAPKSLLLEKYIGDLMPIYWTEKQKELPHLSPVKHGHYRLNFPKMKGEECEQIEIKKNKAPSYLADLFQMALKAAFLLGKDPESIANVLAKYEDQPMRAESFRMPNGANVFNEAYCASVLSFQYALKKCLRQTSKGKKIMLFGGLRIAENEKVHAYANVARQVNREKIDRFIIFSEAKNPQLEKELRIPFDSFDTLEDAVFSLKKTVQEGDIILIKDAKKSSLERVSELFLEGKQCNYLSVHLNAIRSNIEKIRDNREAMLMLKAQGYGSDSPLLARHLNSFGYDYFGLAHTSEAISLKRAGIKGRFFVLHAMPEEAKEIVSLSLEPAISDLEILQALIEETERQEKEIKVHLHVDTGMSRFGCRPEEALKLAQEIQKHPLFHFEGIMTHLACAENPAQDPFSQKQIQVFESLLEKLLDFNITPRYVHALNTSASIRFKNWPSNLVRIGLGMFGISPSNKVQETLSLKAALSLQSKIVAIKDCKKGETISYGRNYQVEKENEQIAIIPLGYFDGMHQKYSGKGRLVVDGQPLAMVGSICMDFMMLNISDLPGLKTLQNVLIFGSDDAGHFRSIENFANEIGASVYELISCLGPRIQRVFVEEDKKSPQT